MTELQGPTEPTGPEKKVKDPFTVWGAIKGLFYLGLFVGCIGGIILIIAFGSGPKKPMKPWKEPTYKSIRGKIKKILEADHKAARDKKMAYRDRVHWELEYLRLGEVAKEK
jgi:hypothetical protein